MQRHVTADSGVISVINSAAYLTTTIGITDTLNTAMLVVQQDAVIGTVVTTMDTLDISLDAI